MTANTKARLISVAVCLLAICPCSVAFGQSQATLIYPANGAAGVDGSLPFRWTSVSGVQAYYLYVGTAVGAKDIVNSFETQLTSYPPKVLPSGRTLNAISAPAARSRVVERRTP